MQAPPITNRRALLLQEAERAVNNDRNLQYGEPQNVFGSIAEHWTLHLRDRGLLPPGATVAADDVTAMMMLFKVARLGQNLQHRDSLVDIAGYAACHADLAPTAMPGAMPPMPYSQAPGGDEQ